MSCIDCNVDRSIMLTQQAQVSRTLRTWTICVPCFLRSEQLRADHANRKAKGLT